MADNIRGFGGIATGLARSPLGIIALFIVLVYGFASLVTAFAGAFDPNERLPLIYFMVGFPILVLAVFAWLVACHNTKLFAPGDFKDESNFLAAQRMQLEAVASLTLAAVNRGDNAQPEIRTLVEAVTSTTRQSPAPDRRKSILWVDDNPDNNIYTRRAFESVGLAVDLALSTAEALTKIERQSYDAIISDMARPEGPREGYVLLDAVRQRRRNTPFYIHAGSSSPGHVAETIEHGGQGNTDNPTELFRMVLEAINR